MESSSLLLAVLVLLSTLCWLWRDSYLHWWQRFHAMSVLRKQGIKGPAGNPLLGGLTVDILKLRQTARQGNMEDISHDLVARLHPDYVQFSRQYGVPYVYWWLDEPRLVVDSPDMAREFLSKKATFTGRSPTQQKGIIRLLGRGLVAANGNEWVQHRRVVSSAFHLDKLKNMVSTFASCTLEMLEGWEDKMGDSGTAEIEVQAQFSRLTADIISRTAFGSNYGKGRRVFEIQNELAHLLSKIALYDWIPFIRLFPTSLNRQLWSLEHEVNSMLLQLIKDRKESVEAGKTSSYGEDLLGMMVAESQEEVAGGEVFDDSRLVGECRTFYLAGHETTATLLTWTMFLLSIHPEWQDRARAEVLEVCDGNFPTFDTMNKLKVVTMVLNESLRLYPPALFLSRGCFQDMQVGDLLIPKGTSIETPVLAIHNDEQLWGPDVHQFKPERFSNGAARASKHPNAFLPFSFGPRVCVGQSFAVLEAKLVLALLLLRFSFSLSASYQHSPTTRVTLKAGCGMPLIVQRLSTSTG